MKVFEKIPEFTYPDSMEKIIAYVESKGKLNIGYETLEKLWYAFSEKYCAQFLCPDAELMEEFLDYIIDIDVDTASKMDYYGNVDGDSSSWKDDRIEYLSSELEETKDKLKSAYEQLRNKDTALMNLSNEVKELKQKVKQMSLFFTGDMEGS